MASSCSYSSYGLLLDLDVVRLFLRGKVRVRRGNGMSVNWYYCGSYHSVLVRQGQYGVEEASFSFRLVNVYYSAIGAQV